MIVIETNKETIDANALFGNQYSDMMLPLYRLLIK